MDKKIVNKDNKVKQLRKSINTLNDQIKVFEAENDKHKHKDVDQESKNEYKKSLEDIKIRVKELETLYRREKEDGSTKTPFTTNSLAKENIPFNNSILVNEFSSARYKH